MRKGERGQSGKEGESVCVCTGGGEKRKVITLR